MNSFCVVGYNVIIIQIMWEAKRTTTQPFFTVFQIQFTAKLTD